MTNNKIRLELKNEIVNIIRNSNSNLFFLIGDNSTGKSDIGKELESEMIVFDNYKGDLNDISKNKTLIITHELEVILKAPNDSKLILTNKDNIYLFKECNELKTYYDIYDLFFNNNILSCLLNNSVSGNWSKLNEFFYNKYINNMPLKKTDEIIIKGIKDFKKTIYKN